jgi:hypothetical protein
VTPEAFDVEFIPVPLATGTTLEVGGKTENVKQITVRMTLDSGAIVERPLALSGTAWNLVAS